LPQQSGPQLHANDAKYEEDEEAEQQNVTQHGQRVQEEHDQYSHA